MMVSFSGGVVGVKHRPTASNLKTLPYKNTGDDASQ